MARLIECVPNFSDGRDAAVVQALAEAIAAVPGVYLLHRTSDPDHHRSVLTFAGSPEAVGEAAFTAVACARDRIDLRRHQGGHPRVGAADVVPFVPLEGSTMADCVAVAHALGERIARELDIPIFFYEAAAKQPERRRLETIRRGGLAGLAARMATDPAWRPDCGPSSPHPTAGVTVVGARPVLVAFNVNLRSRDVAVARTIAATIRESNGGLPAVKAIGVDLPTRGMVQVSMNLVDLRVTPLHVAVEAVRREASNCNVPIVESELIGLMPQQALLEAAQSDLDLPQLAPEQIIEVRLEQARAESARMVDQRVGEFLSAVGSDQPTPAGAAVAALVGALAAQLAAKLARLEAKRRTPGPSHAEGPAASNPSESTPDVLARLMACAGELCRLADEDTRAYQAVLTQRRARTLHAGTAEMTSDDEQRAQRDAALARATEIPFAMIACIMELLRLIDQVTVEPHRAVRADWAVAQTLARACVRGLREVVGNNVNSLTNQHLKDNFQPRLAGVESYLEGLKGLC